jgi:hypothetical protein
MSQNKKHHYVPRFYMKRFSSNGRSINIWNIPKQRIILSANLKNQCYKNYFYGKILEVEKALGDIEGITAEIFYRIDSLETPPLPQSPYYFTLILYVLMQYGRTVYAADMVDDMSDKIAKHVLGPIAKEKGIDFTGVKIGVKYPGKYSLAILTQAYPLILDMQCKLIINETGVEFVTSDNPVVLYNQLLSFRKQGSNTGLASKGLQIFFPIGPHKLLIFYDHIMYRVGRRSKPVVHVSLPRDVYELNKLQACSAAKNIYFNDPKIDVETLDKKAAPFRRKNKCNLDIFKRSETEECRQEFIVSSREDVRTNLKLSFIHLTVGAKLWRNTFCKQRMQPVAVVRNMQRCKDYEDFIEKVNSKEYLPSEFFRFLEKRYGQDNISVKLIQ